MGCPSFRYRQERKAPNFGLARTRCEQRLPTDRTHGWNYGVVANEKFCILDIDNVEKFYESIKVNLPLTYTVKTSRGRQLYFRHTERSRRLGNRGAGIFDFQANNKYVVGEGSTHPSGHVYECINPLPIIEIPDALVDALEQYVSVRKERLRQAGQKCEDRQDMLNYAGAIYTTEITEEEMLEKLIERNEEYSEEPLSMGDLKRMVDYAFKKWEHAEAGPKAVLGGQERKKLVLAPSAHVSGGSFDFMLGPWDSEKHGILGTRRLHIISGASGAGLRSRCNYSRPRPRERSSSTGFPMVGRI